MKMDSRKNILVREIIKTRENELEEGRMIEKNRANEVKCMLVAY